MIGAIPAMLRARQLLSLLANTSENADLPIAYGEYNDQVLKAAGDPARAYSLIHWSYE